MNKALLLKTLAVLLGAAGGYAYYHFIGCATGTCPISSNPYISTGYGALLGLVLAGGKKKPAAK
jgi:hypothetical protein